jgi:hypothetical protein
MVRLSRDLDRPGLAGALSFIGPIILDAIFSKMAPRVFSPNVISMMQREDWTFTRVARRKRIDRAAQDAILATVFSAIAWTGYQLVRRLAAIVRISPCGSGWWVVGYRYRAAKGFGCWKASRSRSGRWQRE